MTVHVKRNGEWVDADSYQVDDEILIGGHTPAVVTRIGVDDDGVPSIDVRAVIQRPADFIKVNLVPPCPPGCRTVTRRVCDNFCRACREKIEGLKPKEGA